MNEALISTEIIAATISAATSLVVATASGIYIISNSKKKIRELRSELIEKYSIEKFIASREKYIESIFSFESIINPLTEKYNGGDGTEIMQVTLDFYGSSVRRFYEKHKYILQNKSIDQKINTISDLLSQDINDRSNPNRMDMINNLLKEIEKVIYEIKEAALKIV